MLLNARKIFPRERDVYIHAAKVQTKEGWTLVISAMDAYSELIFKPVFDKTTEITINALNQIFDNILEGYKPIIHPKQISFVTNLPEEYNILFLQTKAARHRFKFDKEATAKAMKGFLDTLQYEVVDIK